MNAKRLILPMAAALVLYGCGGPQVTMKNLQTGAVASCKGGWPATGMVSDQVAQGLLIECVDGFARQGFEVVSTSRCTGCIEQLPTSVAMP